MGGKMKRGIIWITLTCLIVTSLVLASCSSSTTTSTLTTSTVTTPTTTSALVTTSNIPTSTTSTAVVTASVTTTSTGNWWDSLGTPKYGGTLADYSSVDFGSWDPYYQTTIPCCYSGPLESLYGDDWTLKPISIRLQYRLASS